MREENDGLMKWYDDQNSPMDQVQVGCVPCQSCAFAGWPTDRP